MTAEHVEATFYVQIEAQRGAWPLDDDGLGQVDGAKAARLTLGRPAVRVADAVSVRLTVRLPVAAFAPLRPAALVIVPAELVQRPELIEVEATNATGADS